MTTRQGSLRRLTIVAVTVLLVPIAARADQKPPRGRPNVLLILTDDQGYGDLGVHGNTRIKTPRLDQFARQSVELQNFYVCPVCSPTRSSILTGRYNYRTGIVDTFQGRSMMRPDEVTLAQMLRDGGYRTGIFGKWHLGDNYPLRPIDRGFDEALVLKGGGIAQASDPPGGSSYFDPLLQHNGTLTKTKGYCSDVYTDAALRFIAQGSDRPFFVYLAFNAPHEPLQVPESYSQPYRAMNLKLDDFPRTGFPLDGKFDPEGTARLYGMVTNIDDNVGRLLAELDRRDLAKETIVLFLTDNGPQQPRFNSGLHGRKGSVYEGGIHVPCFVRWPGHLDAGKKVEPIAAHIDLTPTLLQACGVAAPADVKFDGRSLLPLLRGTAKDWPDRTLFFQWHRGDVPELNRACAARNQRWKALQPRGTAPGPFVGTPRFELYDLGTDPYEATDVAQAHADVVAKLRQEYEAWFKDVCSRGFAPPRIVVGTPHENPTVLTRQDWRRADAGKGAAEIGHWEVQIAAAGMYEVTLRFAASPQGLARFSLDDAAWTAPVRAGERRAVIGPIRLEKGDRRVEGRVEANTKVSGVQYVELRRLP